MSFLKVALVALSLLLVGMSTTAPALAAGNFGAIAVGNSFEFGFWTDAPDAATARNNAVANCNRFSNGANDCSVVIEFSAHRCGAVMQNLGAGTFAGGRGNSEAEARAEALRNLNSDSGTLMVVKCNSSAPGDTFVPEPIRVQTTLVDNDRAPIVIYASSLKSRSDRTYLQCLSWRNVADKVATAIKFDFRLTDEFNAPQPGFTATKDGTYTPGINIDDICWHGDLWSPQQIRQMRFEKIRVLSVRFNDDSIWTPGVAWTKTFSTSGSALPAPQVIAGGGAAPINPAQPGTPAAINVGDARGGGGSIGPAGPAFGAVAMQAGTRIVGISTDAPSEDASVYEALSKCNQQSGGANNCMVMLKFSGADKCAALAVDGNHFGTGKGPDLNNVIATALANLRANGGNMGNNIVASPCNSR